MAIQGCMIWHNLMRKYKTKKKENRNTLFLLLPSDDPGNIYFDLLHLDRLLLARGADHAVVITSSMLAAKAAKAMCGDIMALEFFSNKDVEALLSFSALGDFDRRFINGMLKGPLSRAGYALLGKNATTLEELVAIGLYRLLPFVERAPFKYNGADAELKEFFRAVQIQIMRTIPA